MRELKFVGYGRGNEAGFISARLRSTRRDPWKVGEARKVTEAQAAYLSQFEGLFLQGEDYVLRPCFQPLDGKAMEELKPAVGLPEFEGMKASEAVSAIKLGRLDAVILDPEDLAELEESEDRSTVLSALEARKKALEE